MGAAACVCVWRGGCPEVCRWVTSAQPSTPTLRPSPLSHCVGLCVGSHCEGPGPATVVSGTSLLRQRARLRASTLPKQQTDWLTDWLTGCLTDWLLGWMALWLTYWLNGWLGVCLCDLMYWMEAGEVKVCVWGNFKPTTHTAFSLQQPQILSANYF